MGTKQIEWLQFIYHMYNHTLSWFVLHKKCPEMGKSINFKLKDREKEGTS